MALGALLKALRALLERLRSIQDGPTPIDWRSGGGREEVAGAFLVGHGPWGAPLAKNIV